MSAFSGASSGLACWCVLGCWRARAPAAAATPPRSLARSWEAKLGALEDAIVAAQDKQDGAGADPGLGPTVQAALAKESGLNKQALA